jgi:hypothetical protein
MKATLLIFLIFLSFSYSLNAAQLTRAQESFLKNIQEKMGSRSKKRVPQILLRRIAFEKKRVREGSHSFLFELYALAIKSSLNINDVKVRKSVFGQFARDIRTIEKFDAAELIPVLNLLKSESVSGPIFNEFFKDLVTSTDTPSLVKNNLYKAYIDKLIKNPRDKIIAYGEWLRGIREKEKDGSYSEALVRIFLSNEFVRQSRPEEALDQKEAAISIVESRLNESVSVDVLTFIDLLKILNKEQQNTLAQKLLRFFEAQSKDLSDVQRDLIKESSALIEFEIYYPEKNFSSIFGLVPTITSKLPKIPRNEAAVLFSKLFEVYSEAPEFTHLTLVLETFVKVFPEKNLKLKKELKKSLEDNFVVLVAKLDGSRNYEFLEPLYPLVDQLVNYSSSSAKPGYALIIGEVYQRVGMDSKALEIFKNCYISRFVGFKMSKEQVKCLRLQVYLLIRSGNKKDYGLLKPQISKLIRVYNFDDPVEKTRLQVSEALNHLLNSRFDETIAVLNRIQKSLPEGGENVYFKSIYDIYSSAVSIASDRYDKALEKSDQIEALFISQFGKNVSTLNIPHRIRLEAFLLKKDVRKANESYIEMQRYYNFNNPYIHFDRILGILRGLSLAYLIKSDSLITELEEEFKKYCQLGDRFESYKDFFELWKTLFAVQKTGKKEEAKVSSLLKNIESNFGKNTLLVFMNKKFVKVLTEK